MSSTARGSERQADDFYVTPSWCIDWLLAAIPRIPHDAHIVDAGCGSGAIMGRFVQHGHSPEHIMGVELSPELGKESEAIAAVVVGDFLTHYAIIDHAQLCVMNPPFNKAQDFIASAREMVGKSGTVIALLRLNFLASQKRREWWQHNTADVLVLPKRPSFCWVYTYKLACQRCGGVRKEKRTVRVDTPPITDPAEFNCEECDVSPDIRDTTKTTSDSTDYAWFIFGPGPRGRVKVL